MLLLNENIMLGVFFQTNCNSSLQPDVVFDSESNDRNLSSLAPPDGEKKIFSFSSKLTSRIDVGVFIRYFCLF